jgi:hypothetical protein
MESELHTSANVNGGVEMSIVFGMVVVDHLEKVVVVTRAEGLVEGAVEGLAGEGSHCCYYVGGVVVVVVDVELTVCCE